MISFSRNRQLNLTLCILKNDVYLERVPTFKLLEVWQQNNLSWKYSTEQTIKKANKRLHCQRETRKAGMPLEVGLSIYCAKIRPLLEYASPVWNTLIKYLLVHM